MVEGVQQGPVLVGTFFTFGWGTPLRGENITATTRRSPPQGNAPKAGGREAHQAGTTRTTPQQTSELRREARTSPKPGCCAPPVRVRPDTAPPRGVTGARRATHPYTRQCSGKLHRSAIRTSNLQERYPLGQSAENQVGQGYGGRRPLQGHGPEQYRSNVT